ncbi:MAG TPA: branched-chain amino acid ABC transporter permease [Acidimicrobiales bacterium]|nr:branched-chain amino acid ABC transporter permease [Acidimicrobiales bacterium]
MQLFVSQFLNGIGNGVVYGSIALALVLIFRVTGILNFAQGEMALFSTYISWKLTTEDVPIVLAIALSMAIAFVAGAVIERVLIRPVEEARSPLNVVIVTLGMFLAINSLVQLSFGTQPHSMESPFPDGRIELFSSGGSAVEIQKQTIGLIVVLVGECVLLWLLLQKTRLGLRLRAVASNPDASRLMGINAGAMLMVGWGLAAALGAVAGSLVASAPGQAGFDASLMQGILVYAFAAAALGGFDSLMGAVVGGLVVGVANALTIQYVGALDGIEVVVPLALILAVLLVKPNGLFGRTTVERV